MGGGEHLRLVAQDTDEWVLRARRVAPLGSVVTGQVTSRETFGSFIQLDVDPEIRALVEINNYRPLGIPVTSGELPSVGQRVTATVLDYSLPNHQIRLGVRSSTSEED